MEKIEIDKDQVLNPGEVVELHFNTPGGDWLKATEASVVEWSLEGREDFQVITIDYWQPGKVVLIVEVQQTNPVIVTVAVICGAIAIAALAFGWMFDKAYLLAETAPAQALSLGLVIVAGVVVFMILRH